jgi:hypothetical protein
VAATARSVPVHVIPLEGRLDAELAEPRFAEFDLTSLRTGVMVGGGRDDPDRLTLEGGGAGTRRVLRAAAPT